MATRSVKDLECRGKRVLIRVDFNVPLDGGDIVDDRRLKAALPTIETVLRGGGLPILMSHLGRPGGTGPELPYSMRPVAERLQKLLGAAHQVRFVEGACSGEAAATATSAANPGDVILLDNLRFESGEKKNDPVLSASIAALGDAYVDDAFGTAHRAHASMVGVPEAMQDRPRVAGLLLEKEIHYLADVLANPQQPFIAILGGAKVSDKLAAIRNLLPKVDAVMVGGAMAYTFMAARGDGTGSSLVECDMVDMASELLSQAVDASTTLLLPLDHTCAESIGDNVATRTCELGIPPGWMGLDIGPETLADWTTRILQARTVVWNGPVGVFEQRPFDTGTVGLAKALARATHSHRAVTVVGGGETAAAIERAGVADRISHVSTGGGASLRMLEGAELPALASLETQ
ncbi:MAG: phosphoglycerate kinase [Phycisphaerales bacterium]|jgi:phosphoglycerate kinase|nr:phosphoglycerate kinase [Phycisphaerales bacterium]